MPKAKIVRLTLAEGIAELEQELETPPPDWDDCGCMRTAAERALARLRLFEEITNAID